MTVIFEMTVIVVMMLEFKVNRFGGVVVDSNSLGDSAESLQSTLTAMLVDWRQAGHKLVWLDIPEHLPQLIPAALDLGFKFHHTTEDILTLYFPLVKGALIPPYATHTMGVGAIVINEKNELLTIIEQAHVKRLPGFYKLPGGMIDLGEDIGEAAVREVWEETGVRCEFEALLAFRHRHGENFGRSNIYFIAVCRPLTHEITIDPIEIAEACWMPVDDYLSRDGIWHFNKVVVRAALEGEGWSPTHVIGYEADDIEIFMQRGIDGTV